MYILQDVAEQFASVDSTELEFNAFHMPEWWHLHIPTAALFNNIVSFSVMFAPWYSFGPVLISDAGLFFSCDQAFVYNNPSSIMCIIGQFILSLHPLRSQTNCLVSNPKILKWRTWMSTSLPWLGAGAVSNSNSNTILISIPLLTTGTVPEQLSRNPGVDLDPWTSSIFEGEPRSRDDKKKKPDSEA